MKKITLLSILALLFTSCSTTIQQSTSSIDESTSQSISTSTGITVDELKDKLNDASFAEAKTILLNNLTRDNVDTINELAIQYAIYKPLYYLKIEVNDIFNNRTEKFTQTNGFFLKNRGNDAYIKALDNVYFRRSLLSLFKHDKKIITTLSASTESSFQNPYIKEFESTYATSPTLKPVEILEGIDEAKRQYNLALEHGLSEEVIELYVLNPGSISKKKNRVDYLRENINSVFGNHVVISEIGYMDYYYDSGYGTPDLWNYYDFSNEVILSVIYENNDLVYKNSYPYTFHDNYDFIYDALKDYEHHVRDSTTVVVDK